MKKMGLRRKLTIVPLVFYWPLIFILAHIPIPRAIYKAQVSDKALHFIVYFILAFLLWFSISHEKKVNWRKISVWLVLLVVIVYGMADELFQRFVQRSCDIKDFTADFAGAAIALAVFTFLSFWPALLATLAITIFTIANVAKADISKLFPMADLLFHFLGFASLTAVWIKVADIYVFKKKSEKLARCALGFAVPAVFLVIVKLSSAFLGRRPAICEFAAAFCAVIAATAIYAVYLAISEKRIV